MKKLSFCITCMGRKEQAKKTLLKNIADNWDDRAWIEFVFVDFGRNDELDEWVAENLGRAIKEGFLNYYKFEGTGCGLKYFHASIAKNTAHRLATGEYLINLDCDNFIGKGGGRWAFDQLATLNAGGKFGLIHFATFEKMSGTYGRIGMHKKLFWKLGGYDESFLPMGFQDNDIITRAEKMGATIKRKFNKEFVKGIPQSKSESLVNCGMNGKISWDNMRKKNKQTAIFRWNCGYFVANNWSGVPKFGLVEGLTKMFIFDKKYKFVRVAFS